MAVIKTLRSITLRKAAELVEQHIEETLSCCAYPPQHWIKLKTNSPMERRRRQAQQCAKVVGAFPNRQLALMLIAARLRKDLGHEEVHVSPDIGNQ